MQLHAKRIMNKIITVVIFSLLLVSTAVLFYFLTLRLGDVANENQTYSRYISCVLSVEAVERNQEKIDSCWDKVQADTGYEVKRYDEE